MRPLFLKKVSERVSRVLWRGIRAISNFTFWLDELVGRFAAHFFQSLPSAWRKGLTRANNQFKRGRNAALGVVALHDLSRNDSRTDSPRTDSPRNQSSNRDLNQMADQRGDVPGWVLVVLMTTGLVTALWTIAAPRLSQILRNSLDSMNSIR